mgnify:CR=1 FL=1
METKKLDPMPTVGTGCGLKPDPEQTDDMEPIDFSAAAELLDNLKEQQPEPKDPPITRKT